MILNKKAWNICLLCNFYGRTFNQTKLVKRICQWNFCQYFSEKLLLGTFIICSSKARCICIWDEHTFVKIFIQTTRSLAEVESNKCLTIFTHVSITYQNYVIIKRNNHHIIKITYYCINYLFSIRRHFTLLHLLLTLS